MQTHPIIDPNIEKLEKIQHRGHTMFGNFRCISYKDKIAFETTRMAIRKCSGKRHSSCYHCMNTTLNYELRIMIQ
jgi:hypothetical protein